MTKGELDQVSASILKRAKEKAFSKGRPIVFGEGGKVFAEWPDRRIFTGNRNTGRFGFFPILEDS